MKNVAQVDTYILSNHFSKMTIWLNLIFHFNDKHSARKSTAKIYKCLRKFSYFQSLHKEVGCRCVCVLWHKVRAVGLGHLFSLLHNLSIARTVFSSLK